MTSTSDTRSAFLNFFAANGHEIVPSASLVPHNDPTLMFTNAGMVPFKNLFTGAEKRKYVRATSSQKCVRAGGKHNDLDNVGYTARHHTFFEMLGNFSFGDYFKEQAISLAWKLLTQEMKLPKEKLLVTVYHTDDEAFNLWKKISGFPDSKIIRIPTNDNFWAMGDTGPCGPCSEIFYDHGDKIPGGPPGSPDADGDRFVEIWNLVFMQYEQLPPLSSPPQAGGNEGRKAGEKEGGQRINLPKPSIDTGSGLERISAVMQGVSDNYDIDLFKALIRASEELTQTKAEGDRKAAHRVIADHLRASCFLMADGVMPSNEGRGYVLRRIMRRAMRYAHQLGCRDPLMFRLVPALIHEMGEHYPELARAQPLITGTLKLEEERFKQTLDRGLKLLEEEVTKVAAKGILPGEVAFKLYDTYGFPLDLTQDILRAQRKTVDVAGFEKSMQEQKERARAAWSGSGDKATGRIWFDIKEKTGATEFLGYAQDHAMAELKAIVIDGKEVSEAPAGKEVSLVFNQTPFYGESGGQTGDTGWVLPPLSSPPQAGGKEGWLADITDTQKPIDNFHVHKALLKAPIKTGGTFTLVIDTERRARIRANHSATHILHAVLRRKLGDHITQKGSLVAPDRLRFDVSHPKAMTREEIADIEQEVNRVIWQNNPVHTRLMSPEEAVKEGAMALFGEKYGDEVRVISMGEDSGFRIQDSAPHSFPESRIPNPDPYSVELCGGTHVHATGDIGLFKILSESAVAAGIRRIEAVTQAGAFAYLCEQDSRVRDIALQLKAGAGELEGKVAALMNERKKLEKDLSEARKSLAMGGGSGTDAAPETIGSIRFFSKTFDGLDPKELRSVAETYLKQADVVAVVTKIEGKASVVVAVSSALAKDHSAVPLVQAFVEIVGGKGGGGRPEMAQGGGPDAQKIADGIEAMRARLSQ